MTTSSTWNSLKAKAPYLTMPSSSDIEAIDAALAALTQRCGGDLRSLLMAFFSFLHRRTDFYMIHDAGSPSSKMGFREGDAEKILLSAFRQFPLRKLKAGAPNPSTSPVVVSSSDKKGKPQQAPSVSTARTSNTARENSVAEQTQPSSEVKTKSGAKKIKDCSSSPTTIRRNEEGLQVPVGNGGTTDRYKWTQTLEECSVLIGVDELSSKELSVAIQPSRISVKSKKPLTKEAGDEKHVFVDGELVKPIVPSESTWTLEGGVLILVLYKREKTFWETVIQGDDRIDTTEVDSRRHIDTYDESTQAQIRKIIYQQNQARQGLPVTDEDTVNAEKGVIPPMPAGVEYIDQSTLEKAAAEKK